jgi:ribonuclease-3 family protein
LKALCESLLETLEVPNLEASELRMMNPLVLAYIGDGIHEIMVRTYVITKHKGTINKLNQRVVKMVKATAQANVLRELQYFLTEEEKTIAKRGRNQKSLTVPKNTSVAEYRQATGFESLLGWLFLNGEEKRLVEIVAKAITISENVTIQPSKIQEQPYE